MFTVIRVTNKRIEPGGEDMPELNVGNEYTVIRVFPDYGSGEGYQLKEVKPAEAHYVGFNAHAFSKLDGPCEMEILEERLDQEYADLTTLYEAIPQPEIALA